MDGRLLNGGCSGERRVPKMSARRGEAGVMHRNASRAGSPCPPGRPGVSLAEDTGWGSWNWTSRRGVAARARTRHRRPGHPRWEPRAPPARPLYPGRGGRRAPPEQGGWFYEWEPPHVAAPARRAAGTHSLPAARIGKGGGRGARGPVGGDEQKDELAAQPARPTEFRAGVRQTHTHTLGAVCGKTMGMLKSRLPLWRTPVSAAPNKGAAASELSGCRRAGEGAAPPGDGGSPGGSRCPG